MPIGTSLGRRRTRRPASPSQPDPAACPPASIVLVAARGYDRAVPAEDLDDVAGASMTPLEQQQLDLVDPTAHTFWHWVRFDIVVAEARRVGATSVVDVGAGSGMLGDHLATRHPDLTYRFDELSPSLDQQLGEHFGVGARFGTGERVTKGSVAAMLDVIEHIDDDVAALTAWRGRMDSGTRLVVTVPGLQWAFSSWDTDLGHHRRYSRALLRHTLEVAGFTVRRCDYLFPEMLPLVVKRKALSSGDNVDMPRLSDRVNRFGYAVSSGSARLRRVWPAGTSVVAVAEAQS